MTSSYDHVLDIMQNILDNKDKPDVIEQIKDGIIDIISDSKPDIEMTRSESMEDDSSSQSELEDKQKTPSKKKITDRSRSTSPIKVSDRSRSRSPIKNSPKQASDDEYPNHRKGWSKREMEQLLGVKSDIKKHKKDKKYFEKMFGRKFSNIMIQLRKLDKESI
jgi:hypothetical protein